MVVETASATIPASEEVRPGRPATRLTAEKDTPQDRLRYRVVGYGQPCDEVMHISVLHELERQHRRVVVDGLPRVLDRSELGVRVAICGDYFLCPKARLDDVPCPSESLEQCVAVSKRNMSRLRPRLSVHRKQGVARTKFQNHSISMPSPLRSSDLTTTFLLGASAPPGQTSNRLATPLPPQPSTL